MIRKQAMKDVGIARKRKGNYGKQNTRQVVCTDVPKELAVRSSSSPSISSETRTSDTSGSSDSTEGTDYEELVDRQLVYPAHKRMAMSRMCLQTARLSSGYEHARSRFKIDITDLSMLTHFNVGKSTIPILSADPSRLVTLLDQQQWSYLDYVPSRYGSSPCLTTAVNCVLAKV